MNITKETIAVIKGDEDSCEALCAIICNTKMVNLYDWEGNQLTLYDALSDGDTIDNGIENVQNIVDRIFDNFSDNTKR